MENSTSTLCSLPGLVRFCIMFQFGGRKQAQQVVHHLARSFHLLKSENDMILQGNFILLGGRTLILQRFSWAVPSSCMEWAFSINASSRLCVCLFFPTAALPNIDAMSKPSRMFDVHAALYSSSFMRTTIENSRRRKRRLMARSSYGKRFKTRSVEESTRRRQRCHPRRSSPRLR